MKIGRQFNTFSRGEYLHLLENYKKFTDFNHLGLFRSILENNKLTSAQKVEIRDAAKQVFARFFEFLQLKDPTTYFSLATLGQTLTVADKQQVWEDIKQNQQRLLAAKKISHRNIGTYAKHNCGYETCQLNGVMVRPGSHLAETNLWFCFDKNKYAAQLKSEKRKRDRKQQKGIIRQEVAESLPLNLSPFLT